MGIIKLSPEQIKKISELYSAGYSSYEIVEKLQIDISERQIQRRIKKAGLTRGRSVAFRLAINRGRMKYHKKPEKQKRKTLQAKLRYQILMRDNFTCVQCGNTGKEARLQIDHKNDNPNDNRAENLQTLCELCNKGKYQIRTFHAGVFTRARKEGRKAIHNTTTARSRCQHQKLFRLITRKSRKHGQIRGLFPSQHFER